MSNTNEVVFNRRFLCKNSEFKITYSGKLYQNNSEAVFIKYGYGNEWNHMKEQQMSLNSKGFYAKIIPEHEGDFNFCFRNSNNEYDNNDYQNYHNFVGKEVNSKSLIDIDTLIDEILSSVNATPENSVKDTSSDLKFETTPSVQNIVSDFEFAPDTSNQNNYSTSNSEHINNSDKVQSENITKLFADASSGVTSVENINANNSSKNSNLYVEDVLVPYYLLNNDSISENLNTSEQTDFINNINSIVKNVSESYISENSKTHETNISDYHFVTDSFIPDSADVVEPKIETSATPNNNSLLEYKISSPRKLSKFYFIRKKIRLALYRLLVTLPKLLSGNFGKNSND